MCNVQLHSVVDTNLLLNALEKENWTKANKKTEHWISTVVPLKQQDILHSPPSTTGVAYLRDLAAARKLTSLQTRKVTWHWVSFTQHISTFHPAADLLMRSILQNTNGFPDTQKQTDMGVASRASCSLPTGHGAGSLQVSQRHAHGVKASSLVWLPSHMKWCKLVKTWGQRSTSLVAQGHFLPKAALMLRVQYVKHLHHHKDWL